LNYLGRVDQSFGRNIGIRPRECLMKSFAVSGVKPIARVEGQQLDFGALRQVRRFINDKSPSLHPGLDGHFGQLSIVTAT
jgi:hypothetical protein